MSFFENRPKSEKGTFFADQPGKETGQFHKQATTSAPGQIPNGGAQDANAASPPQMATAPTPAVTNPGQGASAGELYGTGKGCAPTAKVAGTSPTDWDFVFPTGFHRPTNEQPEALEAGAERFASTDSPDVDYGTGKGIKQGGTNEGGNFMASLLGGVQMGKHASDPGMTSGQFWKDRANEAGSSVREGAGELGSAASGAIQSATSSPLLMTLGAGLLARKGLKSGAGAIKKLKANKAAKTLGRAGEAASAAKKTLSLGEKLSEGARKIQRFVRG